jgi:hypothetical protein
MNIAELFVNLGIKGAEKTVGALGSIKKGMGELGSTSLEAKAAIIGAMYGLERMMAISGAAGTSMTNFTALTGKSAQDLQKWEFAARQAGVSAQELDGSVMSVRNSMTNMLLGKGAPEGIALLSKAVGGLDPTKYKDTFYMMTKLQEGMQRMTPEMAGMVGKSFGLSEGTMAAMRRNMFTPEMFGKAPTYSDKELASLDKSNIAWANLGQKIQMAFGHFNARHGQALVGDISKMVTEVFKLVETFEKLSSKLKLFEVIDEIFKGWGIIFDGIGTGVDKLMELMGRGKDDENSAMTKDGKLKENPVQMLAGWIADQRVEGQIEHAIPRGFKVSSHWKDLGHAIAPSMIDAPKAPVSSHTVHQTITHIGDAKDTQAVGDTHKASIKQAYRQRPAQRQGP